MTSTSCTISFGRNAIAIRDDATFACSDIEGFVDLTDLEIGRFAEGYATYEPNFWLLDGNYKFRPVADPHVGLMSLSMSDASGVFAVPPLLTITFGDEHSTDGISLRFSEFTGDWATDIDVTFYDASDVEIDSYNYTPTDATFSTGQAVADFKKIEIEFNETNKAYRHLRLSSIAFDTLTEFTGAQIKSARVVEQVSPLSLELPVNTLDFTLHSSEGDFSIVDPSGDYENLQDREPMDVHARLGAATIYMGRYYLDDWKNPTDNEAVFKCVDIIGVLDGIPYLGGLWQPGEGYNFSDAVDAILAPLGVPYVISGNITDNEVNGWIPRGSVREALQLLTFTKNGMIVCARRNYIDFQFLQLIDVGSSYDYAITAAEKGAKQSLTLKPLVTGVEVTSREWFTDPVSKELYNAEFEAGDTQILFDNPVDDTTLSLSDGTLVEVGRNYAIVNRGTAGNITIDGQEFIANKKIGSEYNVVDSSVKSNIISFEDVTTIWYQAFADSRANRLLDYFNARYFQEMRLYAPLVEIGQRVLVDTIRGAQVRLIVEKMTIDLAGGFICDVEAAGVVV
jgi:hypothetical protein